MRHMHATRLRFHKIQMPTNHAHSAKAAQTNATPQAIPPKDNVYDDGCLRVEHDSYHVECKGERIDLSRAEFLMFSCLVRSLNRFVQSETIWRAVWGDKKPYNADSIHVIMYRLRRRFAPFGFYLDNKVAVGYRLSFLHSPRVEGATETSAS